MRLLLAAIVMMLGFSANAEWRQYGGVQLQGLSRTTGSLNPPGLADVMVCDVRPPDDWLSVRAGPSTNYQILRNMKRLAILRVDTSSRQGNWLYVTMGYRTHTEWGAMLPSSKDMNVQGWVHDRYLCDFYFL